MELHLTIRWWIVPVIIMIIAIIMAWLTDSDDSVNIMPMICLIVGILLSLAVVLGHYL
jgi:hypothetical protein